MKTRKVLGTIVFLFGLFFISILLHEGVHLAHGKPSSVCYDFNQDSFMHVHQDTETYELTHGREFDVNFSEKLAYTIGTVFVLSMAFISGRLSKHE